MKQALYIAFILWTASNPIHAVLNDDNDDGVEIGGGVLQRRHMAEQGVQSRLRPVTMRDGVASTSCGLKMLMRTYVLCRQCVPIAEADTVFKLSL